MHLHDRDQSNQSTPVSSTFPQPFSATRSLPPSSNDPRISSAINRRNGPERARRYLHVDTSQLDGASPEVGPGETAQAALHLSNDIQEFAGIIARTTSAAVALETKKNTLLKELEVYSQWQERMGSWDKLSDSEKQEAAKIKGELESVQMQISQQENNRKRAGRDFATSLRSLVLDRLESMQVDRDSVLDPQIQRLRKENRDLKQALDKTHTILGAQETRLKAVEDQRHEQLKNGSSLVDKIRPDSVPNGPETPGITLPDSTGLVGGSKLSRTTLESEINLKLLQDHWDDFQVQLTGDFDHFRKEIMNRDSPASRLLGIEKRLTLCEGRLNDNERTQDLGQIQSSLEEMHAKYNNVSEYVDSRLNQVFSNLSAGVESLRAKDDHTAELASSIARIDKDIKILTDEISGPAQGIRFKVSKLEECVQHAHNDWSEMSRSVQEIRNNNLDNSKDFLHDVQVRLTKVEETVEQQRTSFEETSNRSLEIASNALSHCEKVSSEVESVQNVVAQLEQNVQETQALAKSKESIPQSSVRSQSQRGWEVDEGRQSASSAVPGPLDTQGIAQKISTLENYVFSHEQRLNTFTLEPFLRSIIHQMRMMYPYPDNVSRNIEGIRVANQQLVAQVSEAQGRLVRIESELKGKIASADVQTELLPHLNRVKQDIDGLKAGVGELNSRTRKQAEGLRKQLENPSFEVGLAEDKIKKIEEHIVNNIRNMNGVSLPDPPTDPQSKVHTTEHIAAMAERLDDLAGDTMTRLDGLDRKLIDDAKAREDLRVRTISVLEEMKKEYEEDSADLRGQFDQLQEDSNSALVSIRELQDNFVRTYGGLQSQVAMLQLQAKPTGNSHVRPSSSPAQRSEVSGAQSLPRQGKLAQAQLGQVDSSTGRPSKRKWAVRDSTSDSEDVEASRQG